MYKKTTQKAITSYGVIAFIKPKNDIDPSNLKFLICQRRDTFEYIEFLRGLWSNEADLPGLFELMSIEERERIEKYSFRELWDDVWMIRDHHLYTNTTRAESKYNSVKDKIPIYLKTTRSYITEAPWCFPKGKKLLPVPGVPTEDELVAAKREFTEETGLSMDNFILKRQDPCIETFNGTNRKLYCTKFFVFEAFDEILPQKMEIKNSIRKWCVSEETNDVKWLNMIEIKKYIDPRRYSMLLKICEDVLNKKI